ncbi:AAA family ATPase [Pseudoalteromonas shioyasakiensis]|uniref:AAA family ATPase n=1 Tax=Pseudoalteromonas shioyasakiensis TaxID=1190813 RepID=A0ABT6U4N6_9GAMM|nr:MULTISPECIES: AAA family ATPase [Pseudoalteromonas]MDI4671129.1 AAA family ATPase [Pseudoalteromonas shioyasakiensis]MDI4672009.1 AAA family ATPase [Pseudoalteromonas shioyasakiensis]MDI4688042.1 AAA family ATPase [Pseudoalteromonas shioyasakiensis]MDI4706634.1 AAA family ATPase [Pseudoalteromonas shioyasakiensis]NUJ23042.1 AAA family ATPase [Pseudoalteromonas sp. 0802]
MQSQILPSRAALVDRIALQFEYGQNLICLLGPSGLGKSYLLETFITDKYLDFNKAFVQLSGKMTDQQFMTELLEQSFSNPLIDHSLSLSENFYQLYKQQPCGDCLWVIDGGRHLSEELIQQLEILAKQSPSTLYILIASQSVGQFSQAVEIHLEALNLSESKQLMRWFFDNLPVEEDPVFRTFLQEAHGNPALLLAWQPEQQTADIRTPEKSYKLLYLILLLITTMLLIIGFLYKADMTEWWKAHYQQDTTSSVATALPAEAVINSPEASKEPVLEQAQDEPQAQQPVATNDDNNTTLETEMPVDGSDSKNHNNNVAAIVDSLLPAEPVTQETEQPTTDEVVAVSISDAESAIEAEQPLVGNAWYLSQPDDNFVIQLLAVTKQEISDKFINENGLQGQVNTYQSLRSGKPWWIVTYGSYATLNDAKKGVTTLSDNVRKNQPFYKKISKIKQEIASLNQ